MSTATPQLPWSESGVLTLLLVGLVAIAVFQPLATTGFGVLVLFGLFMAVLYVGFWITSVDSPGILAREDA